jgi:hypothetical protein
MIAGIAISVVGDVFSTISACSVILLAGTSQSKTSQVAF